MLTKKTLGELKTIAPTKQLFEEISQYNLDVNKFWN